jgi:PKD repeat protein
MRYMKKTFVFTLLLVFVVSQAFSSASKKQLNLIIRDQQSGLLDQTVVYFDPGTSPAYVFPEDVAKTFDTSQFTPQIYSYSSDNVLCYSNGYGDLTQSAVVRVGVKIMVSSTYTFSNVNFSNFDPTSIVLLEDRAMGTYTDLRVSSYSLYLDSTGQLDNRFYLHFSAPPVIAVTDADCSNSNGSVTVTEDSSITWTSCQLKDSATGQMQTVNNLNGNFSFNGLVPGSYQLTFLYGGYTAAKSTMIVGHQIVAGITSSITHAAVNEVINFAAVATNATDFDWNFGDSTLVNGISHPDYFYSAPGVYNVSLKCSNNFGCVAYGYTTIFVSAATGIENIDGDQVSVISDNANVRVSISNISGHEYTYEVYNMAGQLLTLGPVTMPVFDVNLASQPTGMYVIRIKSQSGSMAKQVFLAH